MGEAILWAEAKLAELLKPYTEKHQATSGSGRSSPTCSGSGYTFVLWAEAKLGELLKAIGLKYAIGSVEGTNRPHREKSLPEGITKKQSHYAQTLADNPDVIEEVIQEAKEKEKIPTRYEALKKIQHKKIKNNARKDRMTRFSFFPAGLKISFSVSILYLELLMS